ncbi:MAG: dienelactone hydrolase family protein [Alphaproteobacteria bacterium]
MSDITVTTDANEAFSAYLARPPSGTSPGILLIQEIFGVNQVMRDLADGYAAQGYLTLCPDIFWRQEPGIQLTDKTEAEWQRAFELYQGFDEDKGAADLAASLTTLRELDGCSGKVGTVGYCLGGKLAYLMATRTDADCSIGYYGVAIESNLQEADKITRPLMLHMAEKDQFVPPEAQAKITAALGPNSQVTLHKYAGMDHAFARQGGQHYDNSAADLANQRSSAFFTQHLDR